MLPAFKRTAGAFCPWRTTTMNLRTSALVTVLAAGLAAGGSEDPKPKSASPQREKPHMYAPLADFVSTRQSEFGRIDPKRKSQLEELSRYISSQLAAHERVRLMFVCTHNSRRSHMAQLWT